MKALYKGEKPKLNKLASEEIRKEKITSGTINIAKNTPNQIFCDFVILFL